MYNWLDVLDLYKWIGGLVESQGNGCEKFSLYSGSFHFHTMRVDLRKRIILLPATAKVSIHSQNYYVEEEAMTMGKLEW